MQETTTVAPTAQAPYQQESHSNFWGGNAELLPEKKPVQQAVNADGTPQPVIKKITKEEAEAQARMAVTGLDFVQCLLARMAVNMKMNRVELRYLTEEQRERAAELVYRDEQPKDKGEVRAKDLYTRLINKRVELMSKLPFDDQQEADLVKMIANYEMATGKQISANLILGLGIVGTLGQKAYDIATADIEITQPTTTA